MKAFPQKYPIDASEPHHWIDNPLDRGMDLRDYFAAKAMQNLIKERYPHEILENEYTQDIYKAAYFVADAMMKARNDS